MDTNAQDVQAVTAIFQADWNRSTAQFNDTNLVVSPVNSRYNRRFRKIGETRTGYELPDYSP